MAPDFIVLSIPIFFLLIGLELAWVRHHRKDWYRFSDAINSMSTGVLEQVMLAVAQALVGFTAYAFVAKHLALFTLDAGAPVTWVAAFVGADFIYYWWHRLSHHVNCLWAAHVVHHQSEEYNLTTALRQSWFADLTAVPFYLPLAVLGVSFEVFFVVKAFLQLYQFWIHTRVIRSTGPAEVVLNTPSHHRVHHAMNPRYLDRNFGGILIVWDRLFGTFEKETEEPAFGVLKPLRSWNPLWAWFHTWAGMWELGRRATTWRDRLLLLVAHPGWAPGGAPASDPAALFDEARRAKYDVPLDRGTMVRVLLLFAVTLAGTSAFLFLGGTLAIPAKLAAAGLIVASVVGTGRLCEAPRRRDSSSAEPSPGG